MTYLRQLVSIILIVSVTAVVAVSTQNALATVGTFLSILTLSYLYEIREPPAE